MKGKAVIPLILGLGIGLVAVKYGVDTIKRAQGSRTAPELVLVVQALEDIGDAVEITAEMVSSVETAPSAFVPVLERIPPKPKSDPRRSPKISSKAPAWLKSSQLKLPDLNPPLMPSKPNRSYVWRFCVSLRTS